MAFNIDFELNATFHEAVLKRAAQTLNRPEDWARHQEITNKHMKEREEMQARFEQEYGLRVQKARKQLINEAASPTHEHPTPIGRDRFSRDVIDTKAQTRVREEHKADLARSETRELNELLDLHDQVRVRDEARDGLENQEAREHDPSDTDRASESFNRAVGPEHNGSGPNQLGPNRSGPSWS